jgi:hypothetical protein
MCSPLSYLVLTAVVDTIFRRSTRAESRSNANQTQVKSVSQTLDSSYFWNHVCVIPGQRLNFTEPVILRERSDNCHSELNGVKRRISSPERMRSFAEFTLSEANVLRMTI